MKLPHWLIVGLGFLLVCGTWVLAENARGDFTLPAQVIASIATVLQIVKSVLGLTTDSVATTMAAQRARLAAARVSGVMLFVLALLACRCTPSQQGQVVSTVPVAVNLVECVYEHVDGCITAHTPWPACTVQVAEACGTDAASVVSIWASKRAAEARESDAGASYP